MATNKYVIPSHEHDLTSIVSLKLTENLATSDNNIHLPSQTFSEIIKKVNIPFDQSSNLYNDLCLLEQQILGNTQGLAELHLLRADNTKYGMVRISDGSGIIINNGDLSLDFKKIWEQIGTGSNLSFKTINGISLSGSGNLELVTPGDQTYALSMMKSQIEDTIDENVQSIMDQFNANRNDITNKISLINDQLDLHDTELKQTIPNSLNGLYQQMELLINTIGTLHQVSRDSGSGGGGSGGSSSGGTPSGDTSSSVNIGFTVQDIVDEIFSKFSASRTNNTLTVNGQTITIPTSIGGSSTTTGGTSITSSNIQSACETAITNKIQAYSSSNQITVNGASVKIPTRDEVYNQCVLAMGANKHQIIKKDDLAYSFSGVLCHSGGGTNYTADGGLCCPGSMSGDSAKPTISWHNHYGKQIGKMAFLNQEPSSGITSNVHKSFWENNAVPEIAMTLNPIKIGPFKYWNNNDKNDGTGKTDNGWNVSETGLGWYYKFEKNSRLIAEKSRCEVGSDSGGLVLLMFDGRYWRVIYNGIILKCEGDVSRLDLCFEEGSEIILTSGVGAETSWSIAGIHVSVIPIYL